LGANYDRFFARRLSIPTGGFAESKHLPKERLDTRAIQVLRLTYFSKQPRAKPFTGG